jgi:hypothetical protein
MSKFTLEGESTRVLQALESGWTVRSDRGGRTAWFSPSGEHDPWWDAWGGPWEEEHVEAWSSGSLSDALAARVTVRWWTR